MISGAIIQNIETAFLIEGSFNIPTYPEVKLAKSLAQKMGCQVFDSIHSYNDYHLAEYFLKNFHDEEKIKQILAHILIKNAIENNTLYNKTIIRELIVKPFTRLLKENKINKFPDFIKKLEGNVSFLVISQFIREASKNTPESEAFEKIRMLIENEITALSNELSQAELIHFLNEKKDIKIICGLVGACHLPMLSNIGKTAIISENKIDNDEKFEWQGHYHVQITLAKRTIDVHLFGGEHGTNIAYKMMESFVEKNLLQVPSDLKLSPSNQSPSVSEAPHSTFFPKPATHSNPHTTHVTENNTTENIIKNCDY